MTLNMRLSRSLADDPTMDELRALEEEERKLRERIQNASAAPEKILREAEEQAATLPPPDDLADRRRLREFEEKASRTQIRNERRTQGKSLLLLVLLLVATAMLVSWVVKMFVA
jgi:ferric-dicitrate binding protein FerR (iron transport regulator)